jgi:hypothetical protein
LRYRGKVKKQSPKKLAVNREAIRALGTLPLARVAGGVDTGINCPAPAVVATQLPGTCGAGG